MRKKIGIIKVASLAKRQRRRLGIRKKIIGTVARPRVCVTKTNKNIFVQVIDDQTSKTLLSVQTFGKNAVSGAGCNIDGAKKIGTEVAKSLKSKKIESAVFDRAGLKYTGVLAALADSIRENGIQI